MHGYFCKNEKQHFLVMLNYRDYILGNFWKNLGNFLSLHLVTMPPPCLILAHFVVLRVCVVRFPGIGDGSEDGKILCKVIEVNSLRQDRINPPFLVESRRKK